MIEIELEQGSEAWKQWRKGKITASIAPIITGDSPYRTKQQLWREMMDIDPPQEDNYYMQEGRRKEPIIREKMEKIYGIKFYPKVFQSSKCEWLGCSVDGIGKNGKFAIEIKCPGKKDHVSARNDIVPLKYRPQIQVIMEVCELEEMVYCSYYETDLTFFIVKRDQPYIDGMIPKLKAFWDSLQNFEQPEAKHITNEDQRWIDHTNLWKSLQKRKKIILMQEENLRSALLSMSGGKNMKGNGLKITSQTRKGSIDYSAIIELKDIDLDKYRGPSTTIWRIENE